MEEKSILDCVYKTCAACGRSFTLRNFRMLDKKKAVGDSDIRDIFAPVCKCCEAHPDRQLKSKRIEILAEKMKRYKQNAAVREHEEQRQRFNREPPLKIKKHKVWKKVNEP